MRWGSWILVLIGVVFLGIGVYSHANYADMKMQVLIQPMFIGGAILLAAGIGTMSCGYGCYGYCDDDGCGCGHCDGCKGDECCGHCGCDNEVPHEHGPEGHQH
jgi:hypothetical protein